MIKLINLLKEIKNNEILSKNEIKKIAEHDLAFSSDEYSNESNYFDDEDLKNKYLDVLNNPTLDNLIEAIFMTLPIQYEGDEIYSDPEFLYLMDEFIVVSTRSVLDEKRFKEIESDLHDYVMKYSKILKTRYLNKNR